MDIRASEISDILKAQIKNFGADGKHDQQRSG